MDNDKIIELLNKNTLISNVSIEEEEEYAGGVKTINGYLNIKNLKARFLYFETKVMCLLKLYYLFEFSLTKTIQKKDLLEITNDFNHQTPGIKCIFKSSKRNKITIAFSAEITTKKETDFFPHILEGILPFLHGCPSFFANILKERKINIQANK